MGIIFVFRSYRGLSLNGTRKVSRKQTRQGLADGVKEFGLCPTGNGKLYEDF